MPFLETHPPRTIYRGAIILACFAFLVGVAGIFYFQHLDDELRPAKDASTVLVHGLEGAGPIRVVIEWPAEDGGRARREVGKPGDAPEEWLFRRAPVGVPVTLVIFDFVNEKSREVERHPAILTRGGLFEHFVRPRRGK